MSSTPPTTRITTTLSALATGLLFTACSGGGGGVDYRSSVVGTWYIGNTRLEFASDAPNVDPAGQEEGDFHLAEWVLGEYHEMEVGTYLYNHASKTLSGVATYDRNGDAGLSDNMAPFAFGVPSITSAALTVSTDDGHVHLGVSPPTLPDLPIVDYFNGGGLDPLFWDSTEGPTAVQGGELLAGEDAWIALTVGGANDIRVEMTLEEGDPSSNCHLSFCPWDYDVAAKCGINRSGDGSVDTFVQIYGGPNAYYHSIASTSLGSTHDFRMIWTGTSVEFYIDSVLVETYTPPGELELDYPADIALATWSDVLAVFDDFYAGRVE